MLPALALLLALGAWQVQRAGWKAELIRGYEAREAAEPVLLSAALCAGAAPGPVLRDLEMDADELTLWGAGPWGEPGWLILQLAAAPECDPRLRVLVQTGFEPLDGVRRTAPMRLMLEDWPRIGPFTPRDLPEQGLYFRFDAESLAGALGVAPRDLSPVWARWEERSAEERAAVPPATHIGYAVTWFGLAAALLGVWLAVHVSRGRLRFRAR